MARTAQPDNPPSQGRRRSISHDFLGWLIAIVVLVSLLALLGNFLYLSRQAEQIYRQKSVQYLSHLRDTLELPLWNIDDDLIRKIGNSFTENQEIASLKITDDNGRVIYAHQRAIVTTSNNDQIMTRTEILHAGAKVGALELGVAPLFYKQMRHHLLLVGLVTMLLVIAALFLSVRLLFQRILKQPLTALVKRTEHMAAGEYQDVTEDLVYHEFAAISDGLNSMSTQVASREQELRKFWLAVEQSPNSIVITNLNAEIEYVNQRYTETTGYSRSEVLGRNHNILKSEESRNTNYADLWETLAEGRTWHGELYNRRKDGTIYIDHAHSSPVRQADGTITHYLAIQEDITEKIQSAAELSQHRENLEALVEVRTREASKAQMEAEKANQAKSQFLANMSHELRTPMHAILSFARLGLEKTSMTEAPIAKLREYFDHIAKSGDRLLLLLNDLLYLSKLEANKIAMIKATHDMRTLVQKAVDALGILAHEKAVKIDYSGVPSGLLATCDGVRVGQVLDNLLSNAIKFSPTTSVIRISASLTEIPGRRSGDPCIAGVLVKVQDEGIGIPPDELESIFDEFVQSSKTRSGSGGTGLGLAICRQIVELHGGSIHAENNPERGSSLIFTLPFEQTTPAGEAP